MHNSQELYGRLATCLNVFMWLFVAKMLSYRAFLKEHTYVSPTVNVAVYEIWVISSKLMKRPRSTMHMLHPRGRLLAAKY